MNRRSFFTRITKALAIAVAAPVILREAIAVKLPVAEPFWIQTERVEIYTDAAYEAFVDRISMTMAPGSALYDFIMGDKR